MKANLNNIKNKRVLIVGLGRSGIAAAQAMLRLQAGSCAPMEILPAVWMASLLSVCTGVCAAKGMAKLSSPLQRRSCTYTKRGLLS